MERYRAKTGRSSGCWEWRGKSAGTSKTPGSIPLYTGRSRRTRPSWRGWWAFRHSVHLCAFSSAASKRLAGQAPPRVHRVRTVHPVGRVHHRLRRHGSCRKIRCGSRPPAWCRADAVMSFFSAAWAMTARSTPGRPIFQRARATAVKVGGALAVMPVFATISGHRGRALSRRAGFRVFHHHGRQVIAVGVLRLFALRAPGLAPTGTHGLLAPVRRCVRL